MAIADRFAIENSCRRVYLQPDASGRDKGCVANLRCAAPAYKVIALWTSLITCIAYSPMREVLAALRNAPNPPARSLKLIAHILSAEGLWLARINQEKPSLPVWPELALAQCEAEGDALRASWRSYLEECREAGLSHQIRYVNSKGETWSSQLDDVLLHVLTHSAYHLGQIASDMRGARLT